MPSATCPQTNNNKGHDPTYRSSTKEFCRNKATSNTRVVHLPFLVLGGPFVLRPPPSPAGAAPGATTAMAAGATTRALARAGSSHSSKSFLFFTGLDFGWPTLSSPSNSGIQDSSPAFKKTFKQRTSITVSVETIEAAWSSSLLMIL